MSMQKSNAGPAKGCACFQSGNLKWLTVLVVLLAMMFFDTKIVAIEDATYAKETLI